MKVVHTADLHFSKNPDKLEEVTRVTDYMLSVWPQQAPDCIILAGDVLDEFDGAIRLDSEVARAAISFVSRAAEIAPVVIIRGTKSHDRESPYIFRHLSTKHPVHVTSEIEQVALCRDFAVAKFLPLQEVTNHEILAVFTLIPSIDKAWLMANASGSIKETNIETRGLIHDLFKGLGMVNAAFEGIPRIAVSHGMVTGAQFSSGQTAIGEDLEFGVNDLQQLQCDYTALGHVHKFQSFPGNICYSGSPGRLNFGEQEEKGYLVVDLDPQVKEIAFHKTPARRFALYSVEWESVEKIQAEAAKCEQECNGTDVRFRYTIPEEEKHAVSRDDLEKRFTAAGARKVKIEFQTIPKIRVRAAGISKKQTLPEKIQMWAETVGEEVPEEVLKIAATIEGKEVDELVAEAMTRIEAKVVSIEDRKESVKAAVGKFFENQAAKKQTSLFEEAV